MSFFSLLDALLSSVAKNIVLNVKNILHRCYRLQMVALALVYVCLQKFPHRYHPLVTHIHAISICPVWQLYDVVYIHVHDVYYVVVML